MIRGVDPDSIPRYEIPEQVYADYDDEPATGACWNCDHMTEIKLGGKSDMLHHVPEDTIEGILMEAVMRAHCDTLADKGGTDVTDLLERLRDLMGDSDER